MAGLSRLIALVLLLHVALATVDAMAADLRGHGGPVRAIAVLANGDLATASFDSTLIVWDSARSVAKSVLRFHDGPVNALVALPGGGFASAGEDRRIAIWSALRDTPEHVFTGHEGPVSGLTVSPDGAQLASSSWDGTVRVWALQNGSVEVIEGHRGNVNAVLFLEDGTLISAGYDGTLRWMRDRQSVDIIEFGLPINALALAGNRVVAAGADGELRFLDRLSGKTQTLAVAEVPIVALAVSRDGRMIAAAGFRGALALVNTENRSILRKLSGPAFPLWSLAFSTDGNEILTGGADRLVRRWHVASGEPVNPLIPSTQEPVNGLESHGGAEVFKACVACHTLNPNDGNRAGPSLHAIIGRTIGTASGYSYSPALSRRDIIWSRAQIARLFEIGPNAMLPGTKMPEQVITRAEDREALVDFLEKATR